MDKIIAAVDFSDSTEDIINMTLKLAVTYKSRVRVVHTEEPFRDLELPDSMDGGPRTIDVVDEGEFEKDKVYLTFLKKRLTDQGIDGDYKLIKGPTLESIVNEAADFKADLIIAGTHQKGELKDLANTSEQLARKAGCPVMILPHPNSSG